MTIIITYAMKTKPIGCICVPCVLICPIPLPPRIMNPKILSPITQATSIEKSNENTVQEKTATAAIIKIETKNAKGRNARLIMLPVLRAISKFSFSRNQTLSFSLKNSPMTTLAASATLESRLSFRSFSKSSNISSVMAIVTFLIAILTLPAMVCYSNLYRPIAGMLWLVIDNQCPLTFTELRGK